MTTYSGPTNIDPPESQEGLKQVVWQHQLYLVLDVARISRRVETRSVSWMTCSAPRRSPESQEGLKLTISFGFRFSFFITRISRRVETF